MYGGLIRGQFLQDITADDISGTFAAIRIIINQPKTLDYKIIVDLAVRRLMPSHEDIIIVYTQNFDIAVPTYFTFLLERPRTNI